MVFKRNKSKLYLDHALSCEEIESVHVTWREIRSEPEYLSMTWNTFKESIGLSLTLDKVPNWKIEDKQKWLWAKLKYGI